MNKLTLREKLLFSVGQMGIAMLQATHMVYLVYFFFPPKDSGLPYLIPQTSLFFGITLLGLIMSLGRVFDAITDPIIASISDNSNHSKGKRIPIMQKAAFPFALSFVLVFFMPVQSSIHIANIIWLAVMMFISALCLTLYMIPYNALMITMAKEKDDKVDMGTYGSLFWFLGFLTVTVSSSLWKLLQHTIGLTVMDSMKLTFTFLGILAFIILMIPSLCLDERNYRTEDVQCKTKEKLIPSLRCVLKHKDYTYFLSSYTAYTVATYMFETGLIYFITVLARQEESLLGPLTIIIGIITLVTYPFINRIAKRKGKKSLMLSGFILFLITFVLILLLNDTMLFTYVVLGLIVLLVPLPQAIFTVLPMVIGADCATYTLKKTGVDRSGMYVASGGFVTKLGSSIAMILFTSFLLLGKDINNDMGIKTAVIFGACISLLGFFLMCRYNEKQVMGIKDNREKRTMGL